MKTNLKQHIRFKLKQKSSPSLQDLEAEALDRYIDDAEKSENFEVGYYPHLNLARYARIPVVTKDYDSSNPDEGDLPLYADMLLYMSRLAITFYNLTEGTDYCNVKVLMATGEGYSEYTNYITFQAFYSARKRTSPVPVTFQAKIVSFESCESPKLEIIFVRIKPHHKRRHTSEIVDDNGETNQYLSELITMDSDLVSSNSLALYLSQYALASYNLNVLSEVVAKHDIESLQILKLNKPMAKVPTYVITFEAPLHAETEGKSVETFKIEVCMPSLFPTATMEFKSEAQMIRAPLHADTEGKSVEKYHVCMHSLFPTTTMEYKSKAQVIKGNSILQPI